ncbi:hypothetical protein BDF21DRAFT_427318 [Thamnidium elegans]|nr:hypothetical protein BDF21DRAFT_427318 [Thamnidium elegans]
MSSVEEQLHIMQQQLAALQEQLHSGTPTPMQSAEDTATSPLHAMGARPHYDWSPSETVTELMALNAPLNTTPALPDSERKSIIETYPPMANMDYKPPATIPSAERLMNKGQRYEDNAIKQLQYVHSATYRPLDIFIHELITTEQDNPNLERYCSMLHDIRRLMLHTGSTATQMRNNIALRAVDPSFSLKTNETNYTLPLEEFQTTLVQQTAAKKATREAMTNRHRRFTTSRHGPSSSSFSNVSDRQFFRSGPPSEQGGYNKNSNNSNYNINQYSNNSCRI